MSLATQWESRSLIVCRSTYIVATCKGQHYHDYRVSSIYAYLAASLPMLGVFQSLLPPRALVAPNALVQSNIYSVQTLDTSHRRRRNLRCRPDEDERQVRRDERGHAEPVRIPCARLVTGGEDRRWSRDSHDDAKVALRALLHAQRVLVDDAVDR